MKLYPQKRRCLFSLSSSEQNLTISMTFNLQHIDQDIGDPAHFGPTCVWSLGYFIKFKINGGQIVSDTSRR